ncbi:isoprenyl transferase [Geovibrio thiophilus]|uniref:Isoprenyl transferase n=1 Tax=Geovibrio thiophilus TaxID=139438 RepID=A0A410K1R2_9BACT|nr:isoprenyl transferase [Geovibrio thiophilus]QAR34235.1 isoprenyl transferase [Geovibrio thiophilus]
MPDILPVHLAIIMDGNGRWAKQRKMPRIMGHKKGVDVVNKVVRHSSRLGIKYLSLFAFSMENWKRPGDEVGFLMRLLDEYIEKELTTILKENIRFTVTGQTELIPEGTRKKLLDAADRSAANTGMVLNLALSYGGRAEIADAGRRIAELAAAGRLKPEDITEDNFLEFMYHPEIPDVDLLIRTSGELRISNFMLWRIAYSELYFTDKLWPDITEDDIDEALEDFAGRTRRFGKTDEQIDT